MTDRLAALFGAAMDGIVVADAARRCLYANPAVCQTIGCGPAHMLGRDVLMLFPTPVRSDIQEAIAAAFVGQARRLIAPVLRTDGEEYQIECTVCPMSLDGQGLAAVFLRDETETQRLARKAEAMAQIVSSMALAGSLEATLDALARTVVQATGGMACGVVLMDEDLQGVRVTGAYGLSPQHIAGMRAAVRAGAPPPGQQAVQEKQPVVRLNARNEMLADPRYAPVHDAARGAAWDAIVSVPLRYWGRVIGALSMFYPSGRIPGQSEVDFLTAIADQAAVAAENARLFVEARDKAALEERQRLARELHDSVSQALYGIALGARTAQTWLERDPARATEPVGYVLSLAEAGLAEMRALIFELRPEALEAEGLVAILNRQVEAIRARHGLDARADLPEEPDAPLEVKEAIYRIAQEGLHNIVKHAKATRVDLRLSRDNGGFWVELTDNGQGFDSEGTFPGHLGLRSMRERAEQLGGSLEISSAPGDGTRIRVRIPLGGPS
ncbi:MAG: GAF domain-containing protein [Armatimonadetes bacterium]|nr:GAF domain-containing protein [Armatimonadota bacterium]